MPGENAKLMSRIPEEVFSKGNLAAVDELFAADHIEHVPLPPEIPAGIPGLKQYVTQLRAAFPDFNYTINDTVEEGDTVVQRLTGRGTMKGDFLGMSASGKSATWEEFHMSRVANGKLVEHWANLDQMGMLQQLGFIPSPGQ